MLVFRKFGFYGIELAQPRKFDISKIKFGLWGVLNVNLGQ